MKFQPTMESVKQPRDRLVLAIRFKESERGEKTALEMMAKVHNLSVSALAKQMIRHCLEEADLK